MSFISVENDTTKKEAAQAQKKEKMHGRETVKVRFVGEKSLREALVAYFSGLKK